VFKYKYENIYANQIPFLGFRTQFNDSEDSEVSDIMDIPDIPEVSEVTIF